MIYDMFEKKLLRQDEEINRSLLILIYQSQIPCIWLYIDKIFIYHMYSIYVYVEIYSIKSSISHDVSIKCFNVWGGINFDFVLIYHTTQSACPSASSGHAAYWKTICFALIDNSLLAFISSASSATQLSGRLRMKF